MGTSKAALPWHGSTLLRRTVGVVTRGTDGPVVVVRAPGQALPELPAEVEIVDDPEEGLGPLQGLAVGLRALVGRADVAFCCSTDLPFLHTAFVRAWSRRWVTTTTWCCPWPAGSAQPMAAAYRPGLAAEIERLLADGQRKPAFLFDRCRVLRLDDAALLADPLLAAADPRLESVVNVNDTPTTSGRSPGRRPRCWWSGSASWRPPAAGSRVPCGPRPSGPRPRPPGCPSTGTSWPPSTVTG